MTDAPSYVLTVHQVLGERPTGHLRCVTRLPSLVARLCTWDAAVELEPLDDAGLAIARAIGMWTAHAAEAHVEAVAAALSSPVVEPPEAPLD